MSSRLIFAIAVCMLFVLGACQEAPAPLVPPGLSISSFSPDAGPSGTIVVITGTGFGQVKDDVSVTVGGRPVTVTSVQPDTIIIVIPEDASSGVITVNRSGQEATSSSPFTLMAPPFPRALSFQPDSCEPGEFTTITGQTFSREINRFNVRIGGLSASVMNGFTDSLIVRVPEGLPAGPAQVIISSDQWQNTATGTLRILPVKPFTNPSVEISLQGIIVTTRTEFIQPPGSEADTSSRKYGRTVKMNCPSMGCMTSTGKGFTLRVPEQFLNDGEYWHEVKVKLDRARKLFKEITYTETDRYQYTEGAVSYILQDELQSFSVYDVPYTVQPDGTLECVLRGAAVADAGFTVNYRRNFTALSQFSKTETRELLANFQIPSTASLVIKLR